MSAKGPTGGRREYRFESSTARLALDHCREFDEHLPPAPTTGTDDGPLGIGMWALLHDLLVRCGCDQHDGTEFALRMLRSRLRSIAAYHGAEPAREEYHRIRDALLDYEDECETWLEETETGDMAAE